LTERLPEPGLLLPEIPAGPMPVQARPAPEVTSPLPPASAADRVAQLMQVAGEHEAAGRLDEAKAVLRHVLTEAPAGSLRPGDQTEIVQRCER